MDSEWMGRYRELIAALCQHSNVVSRLLSEKEEIVEGVFLNANEWLILEYIVEHRDNTLSMIDISRFLGIPQSSFSKLVKTLQDYELAEKYMAQNNRKVVIIRPTEKAVEIYRAKVKDPDKSRYKPFFDHLKDLPDEDIRVMAEGIKILNASLEKTGRSNEELVLIKKS